jgi:hypothetical protein
MDHLVAKVVLLGDSGFVLSPSHLNFYFVLFIIQHQKKSATK